MERCRKLSLASAHWWDDCHARLQSYYSGNGISRRKRQGNDEGSRNTARRNIERCLVWGCLESLHVFVLNADMGMGIVTRGEPAGKPAFTSDNIEKFIYRDLDLHREEWLNLKDAWYYWEQFLPVFARRCWQSETPSVALKLVQYLTTQLEKQRSEMEKQGAVMEKQRSEMEKQGAVMEKQRSEMEKQGAVMEKQGAVMEKQRSEIAILKDKFMQARLTIARLTAEKTALRLNLSSVLSSQTYRSAVTARRRLQKIPVLYPLARSALRSMLSL